jgi:dephospho-CoA kinase
MLRVGITGGIGSGKSTVAKLFEVRGIPVYYADDAAKKIMNEDVILQQQIQEVFGKEAYVNGMLNRKHIADIAFSHPKKLEQLNALVHPATLKDAEDWMHRQTSPYAIKEAALIFESGAQEHLDYVIGVHCPTPLRIQRTMLLCDFIITNNEQQLMIPQVIDLHQHLLNLAK